MVLVQIKKSKPKKTYEETQENSDLHMNKRGQQGIIASALLFIFFIIVWLLWLGSWVNQMMEQSIIASEATGFELFFYSNMNVWILLSLILGMLGFSYFGGGR